MGGVYSILLGHGGEDTDQFCACDITNMHRDVASGGGGHLTFSLYLYIYMK